MILQEMRLISMHQSFDIPTEILKQFLWDYFKEAMVPQIDQQNTGSVFLFVFLLPAVHMARRAAPARAG